MLFHSINSDVYGCANIGPFGACIRVGAFVDVEDE